MERGDSSGKLRRDEAKLDNKCVFRPRLDSFAFTTLFRSNYLRVGDVSPTRRSIQLCTRTLVKHSSDRISFVPCNKSVPSNRNLPRFPLKLDIAIMLLQAVHGPHELETVDPWNVPQFSGETRGGPLWLHLEYSTFSSRGETEKLSRWLTRLMLLFPVPTNS